MQYLKLETSKLLTRIGCHSNSGVFYENGNFTSDKSLDNTFINEQKHGGYRKVCQAFTWDDICTIENAVVIFGDNWITKCQQVLLTKLGKGDWEQALLNYLSQNTLLTPHTQQKENL